MTSFSSESTSGSPSRMPMFDREVWKDWHLRLGVILLSILVFFPGLGDFGLWDPWEVHYGEVGRSMVERGDWILGGVATGRHPGRPRKASTSSVSLCSCSG
jgi:hypothetical protein